MKQQGRDRQEFTEGEICLPGAAFFGHNLSVRAEAPLGPTATRTARRWCWWVGGSRVMELGTGLTLPPPGQPL